MSYDCSYSVRWSCGAIDIALDKLSNDMRWLRRKPMPKKLRLMGIDNHKQELLINFIT